MQNKGIYYGLAREFDKEIRIRIVMAAKNIPRPEAVKKCKDDIQLPYFINKQKGA